MINNVFGTKNKYITIVTLLSLHYYCYINNLGYIGIVRLGIEYFSQFETFIDTTGTDQTAFLIFG